MFISPESLAIYSTLSSRAAQLGAAAVANTPLHPTLQAPRQT